MRNGRSKRERGIETRRRNDPRRQGSYRPVRLRFLLTLTGIAVVVGRGIPLIRAFMPGRKGSRLPRR